MQTIYRFVNSIRHPFFWAFLIVTAMVCFFADVEQLRSLSNFFGGFAIPVTACITAYIAWRQYATDKLKLRLETYDRRLKIYEEVKRFIGEALGSGLTSQQCIAFYQNVAQADFLFGSEIRSYLDEMFKRANRLQFEQGQYNYHQKVETDDGSFDFGANSENMHAQQSWFSGQPEVALEMFKPYLHLADAP